MTGHVDGPSSETTDAPLSSAGPLSPHVRPRLLLLACAVAAGAVLIDQGTKALALAELSEQDRIPLLGDWLGLQLAFNPGTVMSLGSGSTWLLTLIAAAATVALLIAATRARTAGWAVVIGLLWGGAVGNLLDRLFAPPGFGRGHVTDFLAYGNLFIGNLADVILGIGVALGLLLYLRQARSRQ
ncbi:MAG: signal peptidase II [Microbacterium sp. 69-7]|uniref:signal peptidase II n=1 Tax=Microbacterium sp. 69-7 TaxID=1895784 RepID=UPI0009681A31|nr:signal peptidase II [Microbacterium sp. 69-7]OJU47133.1 MAG: signal peptidase II [Microbacterium sp. 69-7]